MSKSDFVPSPSTSDVASADLSDAGLEKGKAYKVTLSVDDSGATVSTVEEIIPPAPVPQTDLVVFRHKVSKASYLGQLNSNGTWTVAFSLFYTWDAVIATYHPEVYDMVEVVV